MPRFIITGNYTEAAAKGMLAHPSDRGAATGALIEAAGGTMEAFYATTGPTDFI
ncbi:GYD domain-containing protein, partial [Tropicimonas sp. IMCC6043]